VIPLQVSAFFRVSKQKYPYTDTQQCVRNLIDAFGIERLMWGSDFPWVLEEPGCGYVKAWDILPKEFLSEYEAGQLYGGTLARLFPGAFGRSAA
jgi:predicted TIM-barrel fold metal-dependent hydrolase